MAAANSTAALIDLTLTSKFYPQEPPRKKKSVSTSINLVEQQKQEKKAMEKVRCASRGTKNRKYLEMQPTIGSRDHDYTLFFQKIGKEQKQRIRDTDLELRRRSQESNHM